MDEIAFLSHEDIGHVIELLVASFDDDVGFDYVFRTPGARRRWERTALDIAARLAMNNGRVTGMWGGGRQELAAVALWFTPHRPFPLPWHRLLVPLVRMLPMMFDHPTHGRYEQLDRLYRSLMPRGRHMLYLAGLAVRREYRGQHLGRQLVRFGQEYAAAEQCPVFLQCWSALVPYYERLGFSPCSEGTLPGVADTCHGLVWEPQDPARGK